MSKFRNLVLAGAVLASIAGAAAVSLSGIPAPFVLEMTIDLGVYKIGLKLVSS